MLVKNKDFIYKVIQFLPARVNNAQSPISQKAQIVVTPLYDVTWGKIESKSFSMKYLNTYLNKIYVIDMEEVEIVPEEDIPQDIKRDIKISSII